MQFVTLTKEEFQRYATDHPLETFHQTYEWGLLKEKYGWEIHLVGLKYQKNIVGASLLLSKNTPIKKKIFYAPRGFLLDYYDASIVAEFTKQVKQYVKEHGGFLLKIDPYVIYQKRTSEGDVIDPSARDEESIRLLKENGYRHFGFNLGMETMQPRWVYRLSLDQPYEKLKTTFIKSTRKNLEDVYKKGVQVREGKKEDVALFYQVLDDTSKRRGFLNRSLSYYEAMYDLLQDYVHIYIAYLDPKQMLLQAKKQLKDEQSELEVIHQRMEVEKVGKGLLNKEKLAEQRIEKYKKEIEKATKMKKEHPEPIVVGGMLSVRSGNEYITLLSGIDNDYRSFIPKYAMYDQSIKDAYQMGLKHVNFYGITGNFTDESQDVFGVYEVKRGFNGNVLELIGEFDLVIQPFFYHLYQISFGLYTKIKELKK